MSGVWFGTGCVYSTFKQLASSFLIWYFILVLLYPFISYYLLLYPFISYSYQIILFCIVLKIYKYILYHSTYNTIIEALWRGYLRFHRSTWQEWNRHSGCCFIFTFSTCQVSEWSWWSARTVSGLPLPLPTMLGAPKVTSTMPFDKSGTWEDFVRSPSIPISCSNRGNQNSAYHFLYSTCTLNMGLYDAYII